MTIKQLKPIPGDPVEFKSTPRCEAETSVQNEHNRAWRERRYQTDKSVWQCSLPSVVKIGKKHYCRRHGGHVVLDMYLKGELCPK